MNASSINPQNKARSHGRVASGDERRRVAVPRRSTKGPLNNDIDDPLAEHRAPAAITTSNLPRRPLSPTPSVTTITSTITSPLSPDSNTPTLSDLPTKDFSYLLDPSIYHALPSNTVPAPFLTSPAAPSLADPLPSLLQTGHYRLAAISAARSLATTTAPTDAATVFTLLHTRLACLCLLNEHALAAQEAKRLGDLSSAFYRHPLTNAHVVPWPLRMLVVRLAALGYGEWRKGVMGYYELAREAREAVAKADSEDEKRVWRARLRECGVRVANVLVEMGELEGAGRHLETLTAAGEGVSDVDGVKEVLVMEALVWLRVGDVRAAQRCIAALSAGSKRAEGEDENEDEGKGEDKKDKAEATLNALVKIADGDYQAAVQAWTELHFVYRDDAMITQNLAVCLLYMGKISEARKLLIDLTAVSPPFHALMFNLCTLYELCTEKSRERKVALAERIAAKEPSEVGWEMAAVDFKL